MTTPTWEPVGQEVLERISAGQTRRVIGTAPTIQTIAAELIAARALLVALVEAERAVIATVSSGNEPDGAKARGRLTAAHDAIRAHVQRIKAAG